MSRPLLEVADVLRRFEGAYRQNHGGLSRDQARVVRALIQCRTAALGGHVDACEACGGRQISYNSCRDRHCPKCQARATAEWLEREQTPVQAETSGGSEGCENTAAEKTATSCERRCSECGQGRLRTVEILPRTGFSGGLVI
jgi:hypothetical protein